MTDHDFSQIDESSLVWPATVPQYADIAPEFKEELLRPRVLEKHQADTEELMKQTYEDDIKYYLKYLVRYTPWLTADLSKQELKFLLLRTFEGLPDEQLTSLSHEQLATVVEVVLEQVQDNIETIRDCLARGMEGIAFLYYDSAIGHAEELQREIEDPH